MSFERIDMYLEKILTNYDNNDMIYSNERIKSLISDYIYTIFNDIRLDYSMRISIEQSGSLAKGTAIKGKSDIDLFVSLEDPNNRITTEDFHKALYRNLSKEFTDIREQNVSIGIKYGYYDIDVVPAKKINTKSYEDYNDHYLWSNKKQGKIQTNIQKHIDMVRFSNCQDIIMLLKIWKNCNGVEFPSIFIEQLCINELGGCYNHQLSQMFYQMMLIIEDRIETVYIEDPSNSTNIISDELSNEEKRKLKNLAINTINGYIEKYIW